MHRPDARLASLALAVLVVTGLGVGGCRYATVCGDGWCEGSETAATCPGDCGPPVCGDAICASGRGETCSSCPVDCGACPVCGDGTCNGAENCASCVADCGTCVCGNGRCDPSETCTSCALDCGSCSACGDRICNASETCATCPTDCGSCSTCGDRICNGSESCATCSTDCGSCGPSSDAYETCTTSADCINARDTCVYITNRGITRGMCTVTMCANDDSCDFDMFSARGDCLSFGGGQWNCYHRCLTDSDCYPGWGCYTPTGSSGAIGTVCLPE